MNEVRQSNMKGSPMSLPDLAKFPLRRRRATIWQLQLTHSLTLNKKLPGNSACVCVPVSITELTLRESYKFLYGKLSLPLSHTASALPELKRRSKVGNGKCSCQWRRRTSDKHSLALTLPPLLPLPLSHSLSLYLFVG